MEVVRSFLAWPSEGVCPRSARRAAKYAVGVGSDFCSLRVASTAWRITDVYKEEGHMSAGHDTRGLLVEGGTI